MRHSKVATDRADAVRPPSLIERGTAVVTRLTLLALSALLAACAGPPIIAMKNSTTHEIYECRTTGFVSYLFETSSATECAERYKAQGWDTWRY